MSGEFLILLELGLFYLMVAGAALWQLYSVSKPDDGRKADPDRRR
ncbi:hypothetical protein [Pelagibius sp.]|nr:hypothetical protein [Pelagibius sp.]